MIMEIYLNENKAKDNNIDIESCYKKIDNYFLTRGDVKVAKGIYKGVKEDFTTFAVAQGQLPDTNWFLKIVDEWYISYFGDGPDSPEYRQDALESYYRVKEIHDDYVRNQKSS